MEMLERRCGRKHMAVQVRNGREVEEEAEGPWTESVCAVCAAPTMSLSHSGGESRRGWGAEGMRASYLLAMLSAWSEGDGGGGAMEEKEEALNLCGECWLVVGRLQGMYLHLVHLQTHFRQLQSTILHKILSAHPTPTHSSPKPNTTTTSFHRNVFKRWRTGTEEAEYSSHVGGAVSPDICAAPLSAGGSEEAKSQVSDEGDGAAEDVPSLIELVQVKQEELVFGLDADEVDGSGMGASGRSFPDDPFQAIVGPADESDYLEGEMSGGAGWEGAEGGEERVVGDGEGLYLSDNCSAHMYESQMVGGGGGGGGVRQALSPDVTAFSGVGRRTSGRRGKRRAAADVLKLVSEKRGEELGKGGAIFGCSVCAESFLDREVFKEHLATHKSDSVEKPVLSCSVCEKVFTRKHHLLLHSRTHKERKEVVTRRVEAVLIPGSKKHAQVVAEGMVFNFNKASGDGSSVYYTCNNLGRSGCKAKLIMRQASTGTHFHLRGLHNDHLSLADTQVVLQL